MKLGYVIVYVPNVAATVLFYESGTWPDGRQCVTFMDSHVKMLNPEEWKVAAKTKPQLS